MSFSRGKTVVFLHGALRLLLSLVFMWGTRICVSQSATGADFSKAFVNFETAPVHPSATSPDGQKLAVCNLPDGRLELFDISSGTPIPIGSIPVGIDPTSVRFRNDAEAWVINQVSDSISVVDIATLRVTATLD